MLRWIAAFVVSICLALSAAAHRVGVPLTTMEWNQNTEVWEVVHKLSLHDVEAQTRLLGMTPDFLETEDGKTWLREFVNDGFVTKGPSHSLVFIGIEYDGDVAWVYYELHSSAPDITVESDLRFDKQTKLYSLLNVTRAGYTDSYIFREGNHSIIVNLTSREPD